MKRMKVTTDTSIIWDKVRYYNELSHQYSAVADVLTKVAQEMEDSR